MRIDPSTKPASTTMRVAPFPSRIRTPDEVVTVDDAVRSTLIRWGGSWNADIHPSRVHAHTEQTIYASNPLPRSGNVFLPTMEYGVHNWTVDPTPFFRAAGQVQPGATASAPDTITGAQLTQLFGSFDANRDGLIRRDEWDTLSASIGETWTYTGNSLTTN